MAGSTAPLGVIADLDLTVWPPVLPPCRSGAGGHSPDVDRAVAADLADRSTSRCRSRRSTSLPACTGDVRAKSRVTPPQDQSASRSKRVAIDGDVGPRGLGQRHDGDQHGKRPGNRCADRVSSRCTMSSLCCQGVEQALHQPTSSQGHSPQRPQRRLSVASGKFHVARESRRAMVRICISVVPPPSSMSFASRARRSTTYSSM